MIIGPPDAEPCVLDDRAWRVDADRATCLSMDCFIDLSFAIPVIPNG